MVSGGMAIIERDLAKRIKQVILEFLTDKVLADASLAKASIYFQHYVATALHTAGLGDEYLATLAPWHDMLGVGLSTWSETADPTRSDCHALGASPNIHFFRTVLGVDSDGPGFSKVVVRPHLGPRQWAKGEVRHPAGTISVDIQRGTKAPTARIVLPPKIQGRFVWRNKVWSLTPGENRLRLSAAK